VHILTPSCLEPAQHPLCVITNHHARYRDPHTGLPYYNSYAYKEIQKLQSGKYKWSRLVGAWMGLGDYAARGVPKGFLDASELPDVDTKESVDDQKQADSAIERE
jgi:vacuolar protein sorting-associated protein 72